MNIHETDHSINFYLFASGDQTENTIRNKNITLDRSFKNVFFKKTPNNIYKYLDNKQIDYCFDRARDIFFDNDSLRILLNKEFYNIENCKFFIDTPTKSSDYDKTYKIFNNNNVPLHNIFNLEEYKIKDGIYIKDYVINKLNYKPNKRNIPDASIGFLAILVLSEKYKNSKFHLIGFTKMKKGKENWHSYGWEKKYLKKNFANRVIFY